jgi:hypothetical protein
VKRKKTGVRPPRKTSARPTREKSETKPKPKLREGGRQSSPFKTDWKYLDLSRETERKRGGGSVGSSPKGHDRAERSQRSLPSRSTVTYYEPPPKVTPFRDLADVDVLKWLKQRPDDYQQRIWSNAATWAGDPDPGPTTIVRYLQKMATPPCSCGYDGNPYDWHELNARTCFKNKPAELEDDDEDDDLPF